MNPPSPSLCKFPSTPHLCWLGDRALRDDKLLTPQDAAPFFSSPISIEEKVDGANLGISLTPEGGFLFQNRGSWLTPPFRGQWEILRGWLSHHSEALRTHLTPDLILFGEWCYAQHTVHYTKLPDWFLAFDILDRRAGRFWSRARRDVWLQKVGIPSVPLLATDSVLTESEIIDLLKQRSAFSTSTMEGIYLRIDGLDYLLHRAKIVNPWFQQTIGDHWSTKAIKQNSCSAPTHS